MKSERTLKMPEYIEEAVRKYNALREELRNSNDDYGYISAKMASWETYLAIWIAEEVKATPF
jgi:hypothetical protein